MRVFLLSALVLAIGSPTAASTCADFHAQHLLCTGEHPSTTITRTAAHPRKP